MNENVDLLHILTVDDDPEAMREVEAALNDRDARFHFADTSNAINRLLASEDFNLALIHLHDGSESLLEPLVHELRSHQPPLPLIALTDASAEAVRAAARWGVHGCVAINDGRGVVRIVGERLDLLRRDREKTRALEQTVDLRERYNLLLETSSEAIAYLHAGLHIYANPSYLKCFGYRNFDELEGMSILDMLSSEDSSVDLKQLLKSLWKGQLPEGALPLTARAADGSAFAAEVEFAPAHFDGEACTQILVRERKSTSDAAIQAELEQMRSHDMLTGLLNRQAFINTLSTELGAPPEDRMLAILLTSLDDFQLLQENIGTTATDLLVRQTASVFAELVDEAMAPARLSDHVLALRVWCSERSDAEALATRLVETFSGRVLEIRDRSPSVTASVGMAISRTHQYTTDELLTQAETALREAQRAGGNSYLRYRPRTSGLGEQESRQWAERLRYALNNEDFRLVRLPITSMDEEDFLISEFETRLRVEGSDEIILPDMFRPAATKAGLAVELDRHLIGQLLQWQQDHPEQIELRLIPLSGESVGDDEFIQWLQHLIDEDQLDGRKLIIGLHETEIQDKMRELQRMARRFGARGVRFALLDVIPEQTRLALLLKNLQFDFIKLGGNLTPALTNNESARRKLEELTRTAEEHSVRVIAPPVDSTTELAALWNFGVTMVEGDFVGDD